MARIFLQLALNAIALEEEPVKIQEFLEDAWSFSKFNRNVHELEVLSDLKQKYHEK